MTFTNYFKKAIYAGLILSLTAIVAAAQSKDGTPAANYTPVMWESVNIKSRNLYDGPGGTKMKPDLRKVTFIKEDTGGNNKKFRIKDVANKLIREKTGKGYQEVTGE